MDFKVRQDNYNALLKRKEVMVEVDHEKSGTPSRLELKKAIATKYGTKPENVLVVEMETRTGTQSAICEVQVYDDAKLAANAVPKHLQIRDLPIEQRKQAKEQKAKKKEEKPKEEKPKQAKPKQEEKKEEKAQPEAPKKSKEAPAQ